MERDTAFNDFTFLGKKCSVDFYPPRGKLCKPRSIEGETKVYKNALDTTLRRRHKGTTSPVEKQFKSADAPPNAGILVRSSPCGKTLH
jgi:hypothetical protein